MITAADWLGMRHAVLFAAALVVAALGYVAAPSALFFPAVGLLAAVAWFQDTKTNVICYAALLGVQTWIPGVSSTLPLRFALADLFIAPVIARYVWTAMRSRQWPGTTFREVAVALVAVAAIATVIGVVRTGRLTPYVWLNKDLGLLLLVGGLLALTSFVRSRQSLQETIDSFVIGSSVANGVALAAVGIAALGVADGVFPIDSDRLYGWMLNPNSYGGLLVTVALLELPRMAPAVIARRGIEPLRVINYALLLLSILLTLSRSAWLALAAGAAALAVLEIARLGPRAGSRVRLAVAAATVVLSLAPLAWVALEQRQRLGAMAREERATAPARVQGRVADACAARWDPEICDDVPASALEAARGRLTQRDSEYALGAMSNVRGLSDRLSILRAAWDQYTSSPATIAFGIGLGTFLVTSAPTFGVPLIVHNTAAWFLVELGIAGLAVMVWLLARAALNLWACRRAPPGDHALAHGLAAAGVAWLAFSMFNEAFYARHFWLLLVGTDCLRTVCQHGGSAQPVHHTTIEPQELGA